MVAALPIRCFLFLFEERDVEDGVKRSTALYGGWWELLTKILAGIAFLSVKGHRYHYLMGL